MELSIKQKTIILTITILLIFIILCYIATKFGAFKDFRQDVKKDNNNNITKCEQPKIPNNLRYKKRSKINHYLKWNKVNDAIHYKVYCYNKDPLKGVLPYYVADTAEHHNITDSAKIPTISLPNLKRGNYWFRVRAINDCGEGEFSEIISVIV
jgi:gentisate 1,2-dioxygenase